MNNPPAFPSTIIDGTVHNDGMTLRDYFAAKAMAAIIGSPQFVAGHEDNAKQRVAEHAYATADAMLEERNKQP
jgi:hypothetical protein